MGRAIAMRRTLRSSSGRMSDDAHAGRPTVDVRRRCRFAAARRRASLVSLAPRHSTAGVPDYPAGALVAECSDSQRLHEASVSRLKVFLIEARTHSGSSDLI